MEPTRHDPPYDADEPTVGLDPEELGTRRAGAETRPGTGAGNVTVNVPGADALPEGAEQRAAHLPHLPTVAEERTVARSAAQTKANVNRQIIGVVGIIAGAVIWAFGSPAPGITVIVATFALTIAMVMVGR